MEKLYLLLQPYPEAAAFVVEYRNYIHQIDDLIDSPNRPTEEELLKTFAQAGALFSMPFWIHHGQLLAVLEQVINNTYCDSVAWEHDTTPWKKLDAGVLRHAGIDMFYAVLLLTVGREKLREVSAEFREQTHLAHMDEKFAAI